MLKKTDPTDDPRVLEMEALLDRYQEIIAQIEKTAEEERIAIPFNRDSPYPYILASASIERFSPGVGIGISSYLMLISGFWSRGSCESSCQGWLCFNSQLDALLYLKFCWIDMLLRTPVQKEGSYPVAQIQTVINQAILAKSFYSIPNREDLFQAISKSEPLCGRFSIIADMDINDSDAIRELFLCGRMGEERHLREAHPLLFKLIKDSEFSRQNQAHRMMLTKCLLDFNELYA